MNDIISRDEVEKVCYGIFNSCCRDHMKVINKTRSRIFQCTECKRVFLERETNG